MPMAFGKALGSVWADLRANTILGKLPLNRNPLHAWTSEQRKKLFDILSPGRAGGVPSTGALSAWWQGKYIDEMGFSGGKAFVNYSKPDRATMLTRRGVVGGMGALAGMNLLGMDPLGATSTGNEAMRLGFHGTVATTAWRMGGGWKAAGIGYVGLGLANILRRGDNLGPY